MVINPFDSFSAISRMKMITANAVMTIASVSRVCLMFYVSLSLGNALSNNCNLISPIA